MKQYHAVIADLIRNLVKTQQMPNQVRHDNI